MGPRVRIDPDGFTIAKPGFDVYADEGNLLFSPLGANQVIYTKGRIAFGGTITAGPFNSRYRKSTVPFGKTFASPPVAYVGVIDNATGALLLPGKALVGGGNVGGTLWNWYEPVICFVTTQTQLDIYTRYALNSGTNTFAYVVMENTL